MLVGGNKSMRFRIGGLATSKSCHEVGSSFLRLGRWKIASRIKPAKPITSSKISSHGGMATSPTTINARAIVYVPPSPFVQRSSLASLVKLHRLWVS